MIALMKEYLRPYRKELAIVIVLVFIQAIANLYLPELNADIINNGVSKGDTAYIWKAGGLMILVTGLLGVTSIVSVYFGSKTAMAFGRDLRSALFRRVQSFAQTELNIFGTPSLITRNTNDVQQVQMVTVMMLNIMILAPITMVGGVIMAIRQDIGLSTMIAVIIPLMGLIIGLMLRAALPLVEANAAQAKPYLEAFRQSRGG